MRLRNTETGTVVSVSDETAKRLTGPKWERIDEPKKTPARRRQSSKSE